MSIEIKDAICGLSATWNDEQVAQFADRLEKLIDEEGAISRPINQVPHSVLSAPDGREGVQ